MKRTLLSRWFSGSVISKTVPLAVLLGLAGVPVCVGQSSIGDGIPDSWRTEHFGSVNDPRAAAIADPDGDGANNYLEWLSGTDPLKLASQPTAGPVRLETYAGSVQGHQDGPLAQATFYNPSYLAVDNQGRFWVLENSWIPWTTPTVGSHRIRIIDTNGVVSTLAGGDAPGYVDGPVSQAKFTVPNGVVFDRQGNAFVVERLGHRIRKVTPDGMVSTFAGLSLGYQDGQGTNAAFHTPNTLAIDGEDNLYVTDFDNYAIRKVTPSGMVSTLARGAGYQDGPLDIARFNTPSCLAYRADGTMFVADWNNGALRSISPEGIVSTMKGGLTYIEWVALDQAGHIYASLPDGPILNQYNGQGELQWSLRVPYGFADGPVSSAQAGRFNVLVFQSSTEALFPDAANNRIRRLVLGAPEMLTITPDGGNFTNQIAVQIATAATGSSLRYTLDGSAPGANSRLYVGAFLVTSNCTLQVQAFVNDLPVSSVKSTTFTNLAVPPVIHYAANQAFASTLAGSGTAGALDGYPATQARFNQPHGLRTGPDGTVYIADAANNQIRRITPRGAVETVAGSSIAGNANGPALSARFNHPMAVCLGWNGELYVADSGNHRIRKIDAQGNVTTYAGSYDSYYDGPRGSALFDYPYDLVMDSQGALWVTEFYYNTVRRIDVNGNVTTFAGTRAAGYADGPALQAQFNQPAGLALAADGSLIVSEWGNCRLRHISLDGQVTTLAGSGLPGFVDGAADAARFGHLDGLVLGTNGVIYVADAGNHAIRCLQSDGQVTTLAGTGHAGYQNGRATNSLFSLPTGLAFGPTGLLLVADSQSQVIRSIALTPADLGPLAIRTLPAGYLAGQGVTVQVTATPPEGASSYALEEHLPSGWQIGTNIGNGGVYNAADNTVRFGPFLDAQARTLTYQALPPAGLTSTGVFAGSFSMDGDLSTVAGDTEIGPGNFLSADISPADFFVSIDEMTAYAAAWKRGDTWLLPPNPIPMTYVTRAVYLWKNGEAYRDDATIDAAPPLNWVVDTNRSVPAEMSFASGPVPGKASLDSATGQAVATLVSAYPAGSPVPVQIAVQPPESTLAYAVEEHVPASWTAGDISEDGTFDARSGKIKWGPFFDATARTFTYTAQPPQGVVPAGLFTGTASFDGVSTAISGTRRTEPIGVSALAIQQDTTGKTLQLNLACPLGQAARIDYSTNLIQWQPVVTVTNETGTTVIDNPALLELPAVFFRLVPQP